MLMTMITSAAIMFGLFAAIFFIIYEILLHIKSFGKDDRWTKDCKSNSISCLIMGIVIEFIALLL